MQNYRVSIGLVTKGYAPGYIILGCQGVQMDTEVASEGLFDKNINRAWIKSYFLSIILTVILYYLIG